MLGTSLTDQPVGYLVRQHPEWAGVFEDFGIDYCCSGKTPLAEACVRAGASEAALLHELETCEPPDTTGIKAEWDGASLSGLADHIVSRHHRYLREELPRLSGLLDRVCEAHGDQHEELPLLRGVFRALEIELTTHMAKEEQVLFPIVGRLEQARDSGDTAPAFHCGSVNNPIRMMEHEHDDAGSALRRMNELTDGYKVPPDACTSYQALLEGLAELELDMHEHIHKENNILFPEAAALEASLAGEG